MKFTSSVASLEGPMHRIRRGRAIGFESRRREERRAPTTAPRVARMLALAHALQGLLDRGAVPSRAELATVTGFTRARITQLLDLTLLAPDLQEWIVFDAPPGVTERALRSVVRLRTWQAQRSEFDRRSLRGAPTP